MRSTFFIKIVSCTLFCSLQINFTKAQSFYTIDEILYKAIQNSPDYKLNNIQAKIDQYTFEINMASLSPSASISVSGPSYSKTISPVSQSDGSLKYLRINNWQSNVSLNTFVPIELTGGQLSLNSNLSVYRNNRDNNTLTSYSFNYYHLSLNQPLNFFSINKWNRRIARANRTKAEIERTEQLFELKSEILQLFFAIVEKEAIIKELNHQRQSLLKLYEISKAAYAAGQILETDIESIALKITNFSNQIESNEEELKKNFELLNALTGMLFNVPETIFVCPKLPLFSIDTKVAISQLDDKIENMYKAQLLSQERTRSQLRHKRWASTSLTMGVGLSASADNVKQLAEKKITDYNVSLNFSFPITTWSSQKKEYENAKLSYKKSLIFKERYIKQQKIEVLYLISKINISCKTYNYLLNQKDLFQKEEKIKRNLFQARRIIFNELEEIMDKQIQNELNIIKTIGDIYLNICDIEKKVSANFILDSTAASL